MIAYLRRKAYEGTDAKIIGNRQDVVPVLYEDIQHRDGSLYAGDINIADMSVLYFRAVGGEYDMVNNLVSLARQNNIPIVDGYLSAGAHARTKRIMHEALQGNVSQPRFAVADHIRYILRVAEENDFPFPFVAKTSRGGRQGLGTFLVTGEDSIQQIRNELQRRLDNGEKGIFKLGECEWIIQEHIENTGDYRAFVIGDVCVGITKRGMKKPGLVMNKSQHGSRRFRNGRWPRHLGDLAVDAAQTMKVQIAGVDIVRDANTRQPYVIEVNEAPRFDVFSNVTKIDIGARIVEYLRGIANG